MPRGSGQKNWRMLTLTPLENGYTPSGSLLVYHNFPRLTTSRVVWFVKAKYLRAKTRRAGVISRCSRVPWPSWEVGPSSVGYSEYPKYRSVAYRGRAGGWGHQA
jgi:hypothetical protein